MDERFDNSFKMFPWKSSQYLLEVTKWRLGWLPKIYLLAFQLIDVLDGFIYGGNFLVVVVVVVV